MTMQEWRAVIDRIQEMQLSTKGLAVRIQRLHPEMHQRCEPHLAAIARLLQLMCDEAVILLRKPPVEP